MENIYSSIISSLPAFLTGTLGPIFVLVFRYYFNKSKKVKDPIKDAAKNGEIICHALDSIMEYTDCDRVWIEQFHNGGHFYPTGKSIQKFSMIYETVSTDATSIRQTFQNIPINLFSKSINKLLDDDRLIITDYNDETVPTYGLRYLAEETDCKSSYLFALKTIDGKMIGVLGVEYTKRKKTLSNEIYDELKLKVAQISIVLDTFLQSK